jgi:hypothetical protein
MTVASALGGGSKIPKLVKSGVANLPVRNDLVYQVTNVFPGVRWGFDIPSGSVWGTDSAAAHVMAIMLFIVFVTILAYALAIVAAGQARAYVVLKYIKDGYKIPDEESLFASKPITVGPNASDGEAPR